MRNSLINDESKRFHSLGIGTGEVAQLLGVSMSTVRRLAKHEPTFPKSFHLSTGGDRCWSRADVEEWFYERADAARSKAQDRR